MNKKGIALIFVLGVVSVLLLISLSYVFLVSNELSTASRIHNEVQAYYYAEAAIAKKIIELKQGGASALSDAYIYFPTSGVAPSLSMGFGHVDTSGGAAALTTCRITGWGIVGVRLGR